MKITELKTFVVGNPPPHFGGLYWIFVKLKTNNGIEGVGEVYSVPFNPHVVERMIADVFERWVIDTDPFKIERLWRRAYSTGFTQRPDVSMMGILSGIETACWDIIGKALNKPVYELLGGKVHEKLRSYTYLYPDPDDDRQIMSNYSTDPDQKTVYSDPDLAAEVAEKYISRGFTALKFDPAGPYTAFDPRQLSLPALDHADKFTGRLREVAGSSCDLLFGTHGQMTPSSAIRLARRLEKYDPLWFEEPTPPDNITEMARVAKSTSIPIATGERLTTKYEFVKILESQAASILQLALGRCGGILEGKKIAALAESFHAQIAPHLYCGPIEAAANIQLCTCTANFLIQESIKTFDGFHAKILKKPIQWQEGYIVPPTDPGIGVELDEETALAHPYTGSALHLEMRADPYY